MQIMDDMQNKRIDQMDERLRNLETQVTAILTQLVTLEKLGKGLGALIGIALGVDVVPMLGAEF